ncbi:hypothetical protein J2T19_001320 [Paenibacillus tundrae]|uniref:Uncharacterized protein n=1 Tax=Paenibacillus tundrae TaxID=528187 RepID=A0ABT9W9T6_9BACL|nr:hypothetical protein [Paenibacillus tundrae]
MNRLCLIKKPSIEQNSPATVEGFLAVKHNMTLILTKGFQA